MGSYGAFIPIIEKRIERYGREKLRAKLMETNPMTKSERIKLLEVQVEGLQTQVKALKAQIACRPVLDWDYPCWPPYTVTSHGPAQS